MHATYPAPKAPGNGVWGMANLVLRGLTPQRWLDLEDLELGFLVEGNAQMVFAKKKLKKIEK